MVVDDEKPYKRYHAHMWSLFGFVLLVSNAIYLFWVGFPGSLNQAYNCVVFGSFPGVLLWTLGLSIFEICSRGGNFKLGPVWPWWLLSVIHLVLFFKALNGT